MPRTDATIKLELGELDLDGRAPSIFTPLSFVKEDDHSLFFRCEIDGIVNLDTVRRGVGVNIPQQDSLKTILIEVRHTSGTGEVSTTGFLPAINYKNENVRGVDLPLISENLTFRIFISEDDLSIAIFDSYDYDIFVNNSIEQNEYFLLVADAGNIYHQPITGVGLKNYLNSDIISSGLAQKIQEQFTIDKMFVNSATVNPETGSINIDSTEI